MFAGALPKTSSCDHGNTIGLWPHARVGTSNSMPNQRRSHASTPSESASGAAIHASAVRSSALVESDRKASRNAKNTTDAVASVLRPSAESAAFMPSAGALFWTSELVSELLPASTAIRPDTPPIAVMSFGNSSSSGGPNTVIALKPIHATTIISTDEPKRPHHSRSSSSIQRGFDTMPMNTVMPASTIISSAGTASTTYRCNGYTANDHSHNVNAPATSIATSSFARRHPSRCRNSATATIDVYNTILSPDLRTSPMPI